MEQARGEVEASGRHVDEAVGAALARLGARAEDVEIEVIDPGARGWLGLAGRAAKVRVRRLTKGEAAERFLHRLAALAGDTFEVRCTPPAGAEGRWEIGVSAREPARWIGHRGQTLAALQCACEVAATRASGDRTPLLLDVGGYRERRRLALQSMARRAAAEARRLGREVALEPMSAAERRIVHLALRGAPGVRTESAGQEPYRRVVIVPER